MAGDLWGKGRGTDVFVMCGYKYNIGERYFDTS